MDLTNSTAERHHNYNSNTDKINNNDNNDDNITTKITKANLDNVKINGDVSVNVNGNGDMENNNLNNDDDSSAGEQSKMMTTSEQQMEGSSNSLNNGNVNDDDSNKELDATSSSATTSYDDLFPSLPTSSGSGGMTNQGMAFNKKPVLMSSTITQVFHIPVEERRGQSTGFGSDDTYKLLKTVMDKSGSKIEMASSKDHALTFLITGKQEAVMKAKRELHAQFQTQASVQLSVPREHHRIILGKSGSKLQDLQTRTATKISLPKVGSDPTSDVITITGPKEGIEKAVHEIRNVSDQLSKQAYEVLAVPKTLHPFINGPGGEQVKRMIQDQGNNNVRINIPPPSVHKDEISVAGEREGVLKICDEINKMTKDLEKKISTVSVEVKKQQHRYIIGPKGNGINEIFAELGVLVEMPPSDSASETVTLRGPHLQLGSALTKVYERANSVVSYEVTCPNWLHKYVIGRKGANIQKLTADLSKVHVEFMDDKNSIKIDGPPEESDKAKEILEAQVKELTDTMSHANISVDAKYHKHIIGKGGSTVNKLKQDSQVTINIPDVDCNMSVIRIEGPKEGVQKAKQELEAMVEKMKNEKEERLLIENRFHRQLIGQKGESIQKIREQFENVVITFPDLNVQSDVVKLRGPKGDVDRCAKALNQVYQGLRALNHQVRIPVFKQFNKQLELVAGGPAAAIRKIRQETDTRIDLPKQQDVNGLEDNFVCITGKKENVEKAQAMFQKLQGELADVVSVDIIIPAKIHNAMIGARGKLIQSIMDDCGGVHIKFPEPNSGSDKVNIRGPKDDVAKAKNLLVDLSNERQLSSLTAEVRAKPEHHKFLIGRQGVNIQGVRDKTGAKIIFPSEGDKDAEVITILGTKEAVAAAKLELEKRIKDLEDVVEDTMTVDPKHHRYFVAKRGEVLRNIADEFGGVVVSFPRNGVASDKVTLRGAKNCVQGAMERISEMVSDLECQVTIECVIEQQHHRALMGAKGSNIQKICSNYDVQIKIPDRKSATTNNNNGEGDSNENSSSNNNQSSDVIRITGKKEKCEAAAEALQALVPVNIEVEVPYEFHRFIIGQKGAGVRQLMNSHNVNIKVPGSEEQSSTIVITGSKDNVEGAKQDLLTRVEELEREKSDRELRSFEVKVEVKPEYHPKIIGRRGAVITQLRTSHDVNIQLPKLDTSTSDQSTIIITGYEENALAARDAILKIVNEFESMCKQEVMIDHRVHPMIIGRRGAGIRQIIKDYDVDIKLPREGDPNPDAVTVMGSEDNVQACVDHLMSLNEDFLQDVVEREAMKAYEQAPLKAMQKEQERKAVNSNNKGFEIAGGAPWQGGSDEASFPTLGGKPSAASVAATPVWGPRR